MRLREGLRFEGVLELQILHDGEISARRRVRNIVCNAGLAILAQGINWSGVVDQNQDMGSAFPYFDVTPVYGAIGTGTGTPAMTDTQLYSEGLRGVVTMAATVPSPPEFVWQFYYPIAIASVTWTEAGVFLQASSAANSGSLLDHSVFSGVVQPIGDAALLQATFQLVS